MPSKGTRTSTFRLTSDDLEALDEAVLILGAESRSDAIRIMARTVVEASRAKASRAKAEKATSKKATSKKATSKKATSKKATSKRKA